MDRIYGAVEISSNGRKELAVAIVDTGEDKTVISQTLANKIKTELYGTFYAVRASQTMLKGRYADVVITEIRSKKQTKCRLASLMYHLTQMILMMKE